MKPRKILNKDKLEEMYIKQSIPMYKVSVLMKCSRGCVENNLKYFGFPIRRGKEIYTKPPWNKGLTKETSPKLKIISEKNRINQLGKIPGNKGMIYNRDIVLKIVKKQTGIHTDEDLSAFGYCKDGKYINGAINWRLKEYCRIHNKIYQKTEKGRDARARHKYRRNKKGFIPLTKPLKVEFDWHHIHFKLPFVVPVPRNTHQSIPGVKEKHCNLTNSATGWNIFVDKDSEITPLEYVEFAVELNYPEQFRQYWFGDY